MAKSVHMNPRLLLTVAFAAALFVAEADARTKPSAGNSNGLNAKPSEPPNAETKSPQSSKALRNSLTIKQVEKVTGGQVIGVRQVSFQGRQLNMIKLKMPDGRIKVYSRLFDERGRSVENIDSMEDIQQLESSDIEP